MAIISGNWKMNGSKSMIDQWFVDFGNEAIKYEDSVKEKIDILICVPDIYIEYAISVANKYNEGTKSFKVNIGAEDIHQDTKGAFTGNTSPLFLNEISCKYTLTGHSERRQYQYETDELIQQKSANAINHSIIPIVCVGEDLKTREENKYISVIEKQVLTATKDLDSSKFILAYEPVWAIGTGKVPIADEIEEVCAHIKSILGGSVNVLYGGSVKGSNAKDILSLKSVDGVLVGGASMKGIDFFDIIKSIC
ncbi:MAG: triose-phosphate isomerase [Rickettsiales bacterium]|jgi:triosephosphate isomerase|nr:triose-phosphate isomerase [Rickettsiales bacterium]